MTQSHASCAEGVPLLDPHDLHLLVPAVAHIPVQQTILHFNKYLRFPGNLTVQAKPCKQSRGQVAIYCRSVVLSIQEVQAYFSV